MQQGVVIKAYSSFYYVDINNELWECRLRGKFRLTRENVYAGDRVRVKETGRLTGKHTGVIEEILPRTTILERPPVANVDQVIIIFACIDPDPQTELLDRMLIQAEAAGLTPVICFNKADLMDEAAISALTQDYDAAGYRLLVCSAKTGRGLTDLQEILQGHISVFAGPSGSGKSSLLNAVHPGFKLKTGEVSEKIGRGRHTTRYAELLELLPGSLVVDSPGFSSLNMPEINKMHLAELFPEFMPYRDSCRFKGCLHKSEPECAVKLGVEAAEISSRRYSHYLLFLDELSERERRY